METVRGNVRKMKIIAGAPAVYTLPLGGHELPLNALLGKTVRLEFMGQITCSGCGKPTKKSFGEGFCYRCFTTLAQCDLCIVKPELCHFAKGTCREPEWALSHCMQPHYVYLANASGLKVGITRASQIPTRWLDQGAVQALPVLKVRSRHHAGLVEVALKAHVSDRTDWRKMLKGEPELHDLPRERGELFSRCEQTFVQIAGGTNAEAVSVLDQEAVQAFSYPVLQYPARVTALNFEKTPRVEGTLLGIKGQYLILDTGVLNVRKFTGYQVAVSA
jgi:uncharacterized protein DUF2797